jgi:ABC-type phosphate transport system substrate-binding protein
MIKKLLKATVVGASIFAMVGAAGAADVNINIYGASAQYKFWNSAADDFMLAQGCTSVQQAAGSTTYNTKDNGITKGTCGSDTWYIRYTSKASYDGIRAMQCIDPDGTSGCANPCERKLADETPSTVPANGGTNWGAKIVYSLACKDVNVGASDVEAGALAGMESHGHLKGHLGGVWVDRVMDPSTIYDTGLANYRPIVVPFAFFRENNVPYTNLSHMQAAHIFSGQIWDWSDFNPAVASQAVTICLRHAGSGTHATLNAVVMQNAANIITEEGDGMLTPTAWFNDGSSDMANCVKDNSGSVGYADADQTFAANVSRMSYEGVTADVTNIVNGNYPFWAAQWLYVDSIVLNSPIDKLATWAGNPANMPLDRRPFWAAQDEMNVVKSNSFTFPVRQ